MKTPVALCVVTLCVGLSALAQDDDERSRARELMQQALEDQAPLPTTPPTLPDPASDAARDAHGSKAFGTQGAASRDRALKAAAERGRELGAETRAQAQVRSHEAVDTRRPSTLDATQTAAGQKQTSATKKASAEEKRQTPARPLSPRP